MAYVEVDVDLDDFDTDDLVEEITKRMKYEGRRKSLTADQRKEMREAFEPLMQIFNLIPEEGVEIKTLDDKLKFEHLASVFDKYTPTQIETMLP